MDPAPDPVAHELAALRREVLAQRATLEALAAAVEGLRPEPRGFDIDAALARIYEHAGPLTSWTVRDAIEFGYLADRDGRSLGQALADACRHRGGLIGRWRVCRDTGRTDRRGVLWLVEPWR